VAEAVVAADPDRATQLFGDAERTARSIKGYFGYSPLIPVAEAMAATDPNRAEQIIQSISGEESWGKVAALAKNR